MEELEWPTDEEIKSRLEKMSPDEIRELMQGINESLNEMQAALIREGNKQFGIKD